MIDKLTPKVFKTGFLAKLLQIDGVVLAGGAIRDTFLNEQPKDYDIFFTKIDAQTKAEELLEGYMDIITSTHYTTTYEVDNDPEYQDLITVQLVFKNIYEDKRAVINSFDFTNTMFAIDKDGFVIGEKTLGDIVDNKVGINVITKPLSLLSRLQRYVKTNDCKEAYDYIISVMATSDCKIILNCNFYDGEI